MGWAEEILTSLLDKPTYQERRKTNAQLDAAMCLAEELRDSGTHSRNGRNNPANKYHAQKTVMDGILFDSKAEAERYNDLRLLERSGEIQSLKRQQRFQFQNGVTWRIDFVYTEAGHTVYEDVKGYKTQEYLIKRQCLVYEIESGLREGVYREVIKQGGKFKICEYGKAVLK